MAQVFATVNIVDSQHAKALTETANLDSRAMKRVNFRSHVSLLYAHTIFTDILVSAFRCHPKNLAPPKTLLSLSLCSLTMVFLPASFAAVRPSYLTVLSAPFSCHLAGCLWYECYRVQFRFQTECGAICSTGVAAHSSDDLDHHIPAGSSTSR
jgi:hypothetical protein